MNDRLTIYDPDEKSPLPRIAMLFLGLMVGVVAGYGAVVFRYMIGLVHNALFLGEFKFYYDANVHTLAGHIGAWVILVPVVGAIFVAFLVGTFAPEAKGHGVPEVMDAIYYQKGNIRGIVAVIKSIASAVSIGTGGSVGREGPIVQIGSAFGSVLGRIIQMPARQRCILIAAGAGGGIAATFNTPVGAVAFAVELMMVSVSAETIVPVALATVMATYIGRYYLGLYPAFNIPALRVQDFHIMNPIALAVFLIFGVLVGLASLLFVRGIYWFEDLFDGIPGNYYTRHILGMVIMGLMIYGFMRYSGHYYVQGVGYATIVDILSGILKHPGFLLLLFFAKFIATGLTIGSGASGGIFSPSLFMGATLGAFIGVIAEKLFPGLGFNPLMFAIAGMAGMIGGSTGAILTSIIMVTEMTRDVNVVLPVVITAAIAYGIRKFFSRESIYTLKILRRGSVLPEGLQAAITLAQQAGHIMRKNFNIASITEIKAEPTKYLESLAATPLLIVTQQEKVIGTITHLRRKDFEEENIEEMVDERILLVTEKTGLPDIIRAVKSKDLHVVIVMRELGADQGRDVVGVITHKELFEASHQSAALLH